MIPAFFARRAKSFPHLRVAMRPSCSLKAVEAPIKLPRLVSLRESRPFA